LERDRFRQKKRAESLSFFSLFSLFIMMIGRDKEDERASPYQYRKERRTGITKTHTMCQTWYIIKLKPQNRCRADGITFPILRRGVQGL
jgi:hypothetical protein